MGLSTSELTSTLFFPQGPLECGDVMDGEVTVTAANGDTVTARDGQGTACPSGPPVEGEPFAEAYISTIAFTITGGTGRFTDATGSFTLTTRHEFTGESSDVTDESAVLHFADSSSLAGTIGY